MIVYDDRPIILLLICQQNEDKSIRRLAPMGDTPYKK